MTKSNATTQNCHGRKTGLVVFGQTVVAEGKGTLRELLGGKGANLA